MKLKQLCFQFAKEKKYSMQRKCLKVTCPATCPVQFCCREALTLFWERQMPVFFAALHGFIHQPPHLYRTQQQHGDLQKEPQMPKHPTHQKVCRMLKSQHASFTLFALLYFLKISKLNWLVVEKKMYKVQESLRKDLTRKPGMQKFLQSFLLFCLTQQILGTGWLLAAMKLEISSAITSSIH